MGLMRCVHFIAAQFDILTSDTHIAGSDDCLADALSRNNLPLFFKKHPQAEDHPSLTAGSSGPLSTGLDISLLE